ncbi:hypothetical protein AJR30_009325, partial [Shigella flexneri]
LPGSLQGKISSDDCLKKEQMVVSAIASTPQSHDLEILGKVFVVAEAATTVKMGTGSATAVLPVVKRLKFTKTEA